MDQSTPQPPPEERVLDQLTGRAAAQPAMERRMGERRTTNVPSLLYGGVRPRRQAAAALGAPSSSGSEVAAVEEAAACRAGAVRCGTSTSASAAAVEEEEVDASAVAAALPAR